MTPGLVLDFVWGPPAEAAFAALGRRGLGEDDADISYVQIGSPGVAGLPDALDPGFHCVRTPWIRGFIAFRLVRRIRIVMLMVPT